MNKVEDRTGEMENMSKYPKGILEKKWIKNK